MTAPGILFNQERRARCAISATRDLAATAVTPSERLAHLERARVLAHLLPTTHAESLLLTLG